MCVTAGRVCHRVGRVCRHRACVCCTEPAGAEGRLCPRVEVMVRAAFALMDLVSSQD